MSPDADKVREVLDAILRLKTSHEKEVGRLEEQLLHDQADLAKAHALSAEAEARTAEAEERSDRNEHRVRELERILAKRTKVGAASGIIQEQEGVDDVEAFAILRARARKARRSLDDYSNELVTAHNRAHRRPPAPSPREASSRRRTVEGAIAPLPGHADCVLCAGIRREEEGTCRMFHRMIDLRDEVSLHDLVFS